MEIFKNASGYAPLIPNLEGYWEKSLDELPHELSVVVEKRFIAFPWDGLDVLNRKNIAAQYDYQHDPNHEPSTYFELICFAEELNGWIEKARSESKDAAALVLRDVADRLEKILDADRERVGIEIQELRTKQSDRSQNSVIADRAHVSDKLATLNQAAARFWANADQNDRSTHEPNASVVAWLMERDYSETLAAKAATIIRPEWAPTGRKPEE